MSVRGDQINTALRLKSGCYIVTGNDKLLGSLRPIAQFRKLAKDGCTSLAGLEPTRKSVVTGSEFCNAGTGIDHTASIETENRSTVSVSECGRILYGTGLTIC